MARISWFPIKESWFPIEKCWIYNNKPQLKPHLLRREKKDAEKSLPPKSYRVVRISNSPMQKKFYRDVRAMRNGMIYCWKISDLLFKNGWFCWPKPGTLKELRRASSWCEREEAIIIEYRTGAQEGLQSPLPIRGERLSGQFYTETKPFFNRKSQDSFLENEHSFSLKKYMWCLVRIVTRVESLVRKLWIL